MEMDSVKILSKNKINSVKSRNIKKINSAKRPNDQQNTMLSLHNSLQDVKLKCRYIQSNLYKKYTKQISMNQGQINHDYKRTANKIKEQSLKSMRTFLRYKMEETFLSCNSSVKRNLVQCFKKAKNDSQNLQTKNSGSFQSIDYGFDDFNQCLEKIGNSRNKVTCLEIYEQKINETLNSFMDNIQAA